MNFELFKEEAFAFAKEQNCESAELYFEKSESTQISVLEGKIDEYSVSTTGGANLRVVLNGKNGYAYTEVLRDAKALVLRAMDNAKIVESEDVRPMQEPCDYERLEAVACAGNKMSTEELINFACQLEQRAKAADPRCARVRGSEINKKSTTITLCNTLGLNATQVVDECIYLLDAILQQDNIVKNGAAIRYADTFDDIDGCVREAIDNAASKFGAESVKSGEYAVVMRNDAMSDLLSAFWPIFSADWCQKKLSLLAGKENEKIASDCVSIIDNPFLSKNARAFDGEGVPSVKTTLVENGTLKSLLHDLKTAKKAGCKSTSNGGRAGAKGSVNVIPSNLYIEKGTASLEQLEQQMQDGIVITEIGGTHAGVSTVSGGFSLIASGYLVENGVKTHPVDQITIAGNFLTALKGVVAVGSDMFFGFPQECLIGTPSVLFDKLIVSGE